MRLTLPFPFLILAATISVAAVPARARDPQAGGGAVVVPQMDEAAKRELRHKDVQWLAMQPVLPDPVTASVERLEMTADVLRARRLPEDALDYYVYALKRGGDEARLLNKLGITELELEHVAKARMYFLTAVKLHKKDPEGWNNLGAVEHIGERYRSAVGDYTKAIKLNKKAAVYHSNLGTAYFEMKDYESGGREFSKALMLDPKVLENSGSSGATARVLREGNRGRFSFEMAKLYALEGDETRMLYELEVASESRFDIATEMSSSPVLARYRKDPRVLVIIKNAHDLSHRESFAKTLPMTPLPPATP